ncbi:EAL domain-containing protein [Anaerosporobacter faecicola]|uniref:EAL domain-containing protein n=1 Tax=Anaerosporobacter faecicola TaxID=2718714 RepID=UPI001439AAF5|nr:EAL domain-containing protein [Anaerosporobacter faecicola]
MNKKKYLCEVLLTVIAVILFCALPTHAQEDKKTIRIGYIDYAGFIEKTVDGDYTGYGVEYLNEIAKYTGWKYEYVFDTWENCLDKLKKGQIDLLCTAQYTKERAEIYDFSKYSCGKEYGVLYVNPDDNKFYYNDIQAFDHAVIGLLKGSFQNEAFAEYAKKMGFTYKVKEYDTDALLEEALIKGEIDAMVAGSLSWKGNLRMVAKFSVDPFFYMTTQGNDGLLEELNDAMEQIQCNHPYFEMQLYDKYYSTSVTSTQPLFTKAETNYIKNADVKKVGYIKNWYPYSYTNEQGEAAGACIQLCKSLEKLSGLRFQYVLYHSLQDMIQDLDDDKIDLIAVMPNVSKQMGDELLYLSEPYLISQFMLLNSEQYFNQTKDQSMVALKSMKHLSQYFKEQFQIKQIFWADSLMDLVEAVEDHSADVGVIDYYLVNKALQMGDPENLLVSQIPDAKIELTLAMKQAENTTLLGILNNCIEYIQPMESYEAINMELSNQKTVFNLKAFLREYSTLIFTVSLGAILVVIIMVSILRKVYSQIITYDKLTGCYNQANFEKKVPKIIDESGKKKYYIMTFDIYRFKFFKQYYGRKLSEDLLRAIAEKVRTLLFEEEIIARTSEDSFALLVNDANYMKLIQEFYFLLDEIKQQFKLDIELIVNFGLYPIEDKSEPVSTMIDKAILAQKIVQERKKSIFAIYTDEMEKQLISETRIEEEMKRALKEGEFQVYYQPKIDLLTKKIVGAEALIRWIKPDGSVIYPNQFIPIFERDGFIEEIDYFVLAEVSRFIMKRMKAGLPVFPISVNQSRYLFSNPKYVDNILTILDINGLSGEYIELEITETLYMENRTLLARVANKLREHKIKFSIDDFGSGYSSLNLLAELPVDILKIDREFLKDCEESDVKKAVIVTVVELAHKLNLQVVCEGIETKSHEEFLEAIACDVGQGFYYAKPLCVEDFNMYIEEHIE